MADERPPTQPLKTKEYLVKYPDHNNAARTNRDLWRQILELLAIQCVARGERVSRNDVRNAIVLSEQVNREAEGKADCFAVVESKIPKWAQNEAQVVLVVFDMPSWIADARELAPDDEHKVFASFHATVYDRKWTDIALELKFESVHGRVSWLRLCEELQLGGYIEFLAESVV